MIPVGIDALDVYASTLSVEARDILVARGAADPDGILERFGFLRRSVTPPWEDAVTLAANAARPLVEEAGRDAFELLLVATESGLDYGKPLSSYLHKYLSLPARCRNLELKHACYAGTAALQLAAAWLRTGARPGKKALVIMTDLSRALFNHPAAVEAEGGCGAVALVVSCEPRVLVLEPDSGVAATEAYDVARPTATLEHGNAKLSVAAYLDLLEGAWEAYRDGRPLTLAHFEHLVLHTPLVPLVEQAFRMLAEEAGVADVHATFERMVRPSLALCREVGNIYSGTLYLALACLLETARPAAGARIGMYSYGSGSCGELFSGLVAAGAVGEIERRGIRQHLAGRRRITVADYEAAIDAGERAQVAADFAPPSDSFGGLFDERYRDHGRLVLQSVQGYYRTYRWS